MSEKTLEERKVEALEKIAEYLGYLADCAIEDSQGHTMLRTWDCEPEW